VAGVRTAESHRHAETLRRAYCDVRTERPGRRDQCQCQQIRRDDGESACDVGGVYDGARVPDETGCCGVLHEHAEELIRQSLACDEVTLYEFDAESRCASLEKRL